MLLMTKIERWEYHLHLTGYKPKAEEIISAREWYQDWTKEVSEGVTITVTIYNGTPELRAEINVGGSTIETTVRGLRGLRRLEKLIK